METKPSRWPFFYAVAAFALIAITLSAFWNTPPRNALAADAKTPVATLPAQNDAVATFAGGCFWSMEAMFTQLKGVKSAEPGYAGGTTENPTYEKVGTGKTGHAETFNVIYDPKEISYETLLKVFFTVHDPTTLNRQGGDVGTNYRSAIFYRDAEQKQVAEQVKKDAAKDWKDPIVTEIVAYKEFYRAEDYHLDYYNLHPKQPYCSNVVAPKIEKFQKKFADLLKK